MELLQQATEEVRTSERFCATLQLIQALGSVLNRGTYLAKTLGFKIESLATVCCMWECCESVYGDACMQLVLALVSV